MTEKEHIRITPPRKLSVGLPEIWKNRELLYFFVWRDIKVKYKQTYLGIMWVVLQPVMLMVIFYFVFSHALNVKVGMEYPIYAFSGLTLWGLFSSGISNSSDSLLSNAQIIRKIYFPRLLIPISSILAAMVDFLFAFILLLIFCLFFKQSINWKAIFIFPLAFGITVLSSFGIGCFLAALNVKYRDFRYLLPFFIQLLFFGSQIVYSIENLSFKWIKPLLFLNPLNSALELFRYPFTTNGIYWEGVFIGLTSSLLMLVIGIIYFKKTEAYFADLI